MPIKITNEIINLKTFQSSALKFMKYYPERCCYIFKNLSNVPQYIGATKQFSHENLHTTKYTYILYFRCLKSLSESTQLARFIYLFYLGCQASDMEVKHACDSRIIIKNSRANLVLANRASISKSSETVTMVFSQVFQLDFSVIVLTGSSGVNTALLYSPGVGYRSSRQPLLNYLPHSCLLIRVQTGLKSLS